MHFPFCARKCAYCDFCSFPADAATIETYCCALEREIRLCAPALREETVDTVFLGGGTPSLVPPGAMTRVARALRENFDFAPETEFTSEANPGTLTAEWLDALLPLGLNRLSLGVQAKQERLLRALGRIHDFAQALAALKLAKERGLHNVSADVMFGLPEQTPDDLIDTLSALCDLPHLSVYSLIVEPGTPLEERVRNGQATLPDDDCVAGMLENVSAFLQGRGFERYEISNYARPGFACRHNMGYWTGKRYVGLGLNAAGLLAPEAAQAARGARYVRTANVDALPAYLRMLTENRLPRASTTLVSDADAQYETVMLGLRTSQGVSYAAFEQAYGLSLDERCGGRIARLRAEGLIAPLSGDEPRLALTDRGMNVQNAVLLRLLDNL